MKKHEIIIKMLALSGRSQEAHIEGNHENAVILSMIWNNLDETIGTRRLGFTDLFETIWRNGCGYNDFDAPM